MIRKPAVLITGANGEIGHGLIEYFGGHENGRSIVALDLHPIDARLGNHCVAWPESGFAATCEGYLDLESLPALCGCVDGSCAWFRN